MPALCLASQMTRRPETEPQLLPKDFPWRLDKWRRNTHMKRWVSSDVATSPKVQRELKNFFMKHGVKQVVMSEGNMGCPHEEGLDFPSGEECPFCEFWRGKQGIVLKNEPPPE